MFFDIIRLLSATCPGFGLNCTCCCRPKAEREEAGRLKAESAWRLCRKGIGQIIAHQARRGFKK
jgi:hypothetical protein